MKSLVFKGRCFCSSLAFFSIFIYNHCFYFTRFGAKLGLLWEISESKINVWKERFRSLFFFPCDLVLFVVFSLVYFISLFYCLMFQCASNDSRKSLPRRKAFRRKKPLLNFQMLRVFFFVFSFFFRFFRFQAFFGLVFCFWTELPRKTKNTLPIASLFVRFRKCEYWIKQTIVRRTVKNFEKKSRKIEPTSLFKCRVVQKDENRMKTDFSLYRNGI